MHENTRETTNFYWHGLENVIVTLSHNSDFFLIFIYFKIIKKVMTFFIIPWRKKATFQMYINIYNVPDTKIYNQ